MGVSYRVLMVEDDASAAGELQEYLQRFGQVHDVRFEVLWLKTAFDVAREAGKHDLIFLDIDLPGINGIEAAQLLRGFDEVTPIVFVTNLAQYAVRGYEVDALDFMVKPVSYPDFAFRMNKVLRRLRASVGATLAVSTPGGVRVIPLAQLDYIEVHGHDLVYHVADEEPLHVRGSLVEFERKGLPPMLVRISKSVLANMERIVWLRGSVLRLRGGESLQISRSYKAEATQSIVRYLGER